jgi:hypothetical protein
MRLSNLLWLSLLGVMLAGLFQVKYEVQKLERQLAGIRKQSAEIRETIGILHAEWNYLNRPARLARLSKPLGLEPVSNAQLADFATLPARFDTPAAPTARPARAVPKPGRRRAGR